MSTKYPAYNLLNSETGQIIECSADGMACRIRWNDGTQHWYSYGDCHWSGDSIVVECPPMDPPVRDFNMELSGELTFH